MKIVRHKKGQFIVLATLTVAIMIVSIGTIMYGTITYFKHERWQEYLMIIDNIELGSQRVVEISLANYTLMLKNETLRNNLDQWRTNVTMAYPGFGVVLTYLLADRQYSAYGVNIGYEDGLALEWGEEKAYSAANATISLNLTSIGLVGYEFIAVSFLKVWIRDAEWNNENNRLTIQLTVNKEEDIPVINLQKSNFPEVLVDGQPKNFTFSQKYSQGSFVYEIRCDSITSLPPSVQITVIDNRNIKVIANSTVSQG